MVFAFEAPIWKHLEKGWVTRTGHRMDSTHTQACINNWCVHVSVHCTLEILFINSYRRSILFYCIICWILPHSSGLQQPHAGSWPVMQGKHFDCNVADGKSLFIWTYLCDISLPPPPWHPVLSPKSAKRSQRIYVLAPRVWGFALHLAKCKLTSPCPSGDRRPDTLSRSKWWHVSMCDKEQQDFGKETPVALMQ